MSAIPKIDLGIAGLDDVKKLDDSGNPVYSAVQKNIGRTVAVKILSLHNEPLLPRRFDRRRRDFVRYTSSSNVVPLYDSGETTRGKPYIVMPYFKTGSLQDQINRGKTPWHLAAPVIQQIAESVAGAHASGISFGDIRPASILLSKPDTPRLAVYGMATRRLDDGRPSFTAPELDCDKGPQPASDVFSLALTLCAVICGETPLRLESTAEFVDRVKLLVPARVHELLLYATTLATANRYGSCRHLAVVLANAIAAEQAPPTGPKSSPPINSETTIEPEPAASDHSLAETAPATGRRVLEPAEPSMAKKSAARDPDGKEANEPKPLDNRSDKLVHLESGASSQAVKRAKAGPSLTHTGVGSGRNVSKRNVSKRNVSKRNALRRNVLRGDVLKINIFERNSPRYTLLRRTMSKFGGLEESRGDLSSQKLGSTISTSERPVGGPEFTSEPTENGVVGSTEQVDLSALDVKQSFAPKTIDPLATSTFFNQAPPGTAAQPGVPAQTVPSQFSATRQPLDSTEPNLVPAPQATSSSTFPSDIAQRPPDVRLKAQPAASNSLWLSICDNWQSNRQWFTMALVVGAVAAGSLIAITLVRAGGGNSNTTGADLPPLTTQPKGLDTPEFIAPPAGTDVPETEQDPTPTTNKPAETKPTETTPTPSTAPPTTAPPTTVAPTTIAPTTVAPTTVAPTTVDPPAPEASTMKKS